MVDAAGSEPTVVVAQSLGAFTGPLVCDRIPVQQLVLLNPMVPAPGETAGDWGQHTGHEQARSGNAARNGLPAEFDLLTGFFHDVPADVTEQAFAADDVPAELDGVFVDRWPLTAWPDVPTRILQGEDDRFSPLEFQRRIVRERLGINIDVLPGDHLLALSQPAALASALVN
ncbi:MAG: alpha/beta hydrolase [Actinomycetota bacterium]|nr:alpha/beta hydrolase [Actinomycetota bacterium]